MTDLELAGTIRDYCSREVAPLRDRVLVLETELRQRDERIKALEARTLIPGPKGDTGERGESGPQGERGERGESGLAGPAGERGERGEVGPRGEQGNPGERGETGAVGPAGPQGERGPAGERGEKGETGEAGIRGADGAIGPAGERGPQGERGERGESGAQGQRGEAGPIGPQGERGADGRTPTPEELTALADASAGRRFAEWALGWERGANDTLQRAVERLRQPEDGKDGAPGRDGLGFDDMRVEDNGDGDVTLVFTRGSEEKRFGIRFPRMRYQGIYEQGRAYREGDSVTYDGSVFVALKDSPDGTPQADGDWKLAVKRGGVGRNGKDGRDGKDGKEGPPGRDLRYT